MDILALLISFISSLILPFTTAPAPAPEPAPETVSVVACQHEDGSGDQTFPCYWNGGENGLGDRYTLTEPVQSEPEPEPADDYDAGVTFDDGDGALVVDEPTGRMDAQYERYMNEHPEERNADRSQADAAYLAANGEPAPHAGSS